MNGEQEDAATAQAWDNHIGAEQAAKFPSPHALPALATVHALLHAAGLSRIDVRGEMGQARFPSPQARACSYGAPAGLEAEAATRDALCTDMARRLQPYCAGMYHKANCVTCRLCLNRCIRDFHDST